MSRILPKAPFSLPAEAQHGWNELVRNLKLELEEKHDGIIGIGYRVSGAVSVSANIDLGAVEVTATAQALAKLIKDLKDRGFLRADIIP